jgi:hypothetical protein
MVTRQASPLSLIPLEPSATSVGDLIEVAPGSPPLMVVNSVELVQAEKVYEVAQEVPAQITTLEEALPELMVPMALEEPVTEEMAWEATTQTAPTLEEPVMEESSAILI